MTKFQLLMFFLTVMIFLMISLGVVLLYSISTNLSDIHSTTKAWDAQLVIGAE